MEFKDIERLVAADEPLPPNADMFDEFAYLSLSDTLLKYRRRVYTRTQAADKKQKARLAVAQLRNNDEQAMRIMKDKQQAIKVSDNFRTLLQTKLREKTDLGELLALACMTIAAITGDKTLAYGEVHKRLEKYGYEEVRNNDTV